MAPTKSLLRVKGRADCRAPPQLGLHRPDYARRRRRWSWRVAPQQPTGYGEKGELTLVEAGQDDSQEFGGKLQQQGRRLRRDGRGWRQEEGAQSVGDGEALCGLLVAVARRGELALAARPLFRAIYKSERKMRWVKT